MNDNDIIEMNKEEFRLLVALASVARNPRLCQGVTPYIGGSARRVAASRAHDTAKELLREADQND